MTATGNDAEESIHNIYNRTGIARLRLIMGLEYYWLAGTRVRDRSS